jgi:hypothetical protein
MESVAQPKIEPDDLERALAVIREKAREEPVAAKIFDRIVDDVLRPWHGAVFWGDRLLTIDKSTGFAKRPGFDALLREVDAGKGCNQYASPDRLAWRLHVMFWASSCAYKVPGDFVECGVTHGDMPWIITEMFDFPKAGKRFFGFDTFAGFDFRYSSERDFPDDPRFFYRLHDESRADPQRCEKVIQRFAGKPYVKIIRGTVPDILTEQAPEKIAFLHLDMNAPLASKGALELLFDRMSPGAFAVFDDYGWIQYRREKEVADDFFGARGYHVLELPTGQGLVII